LGVLVGAVTGRADVRLAGVALFLHAIPLILQPFINALAAFHFVRPPWMDSQFWKKAG
jgi:hypothetical protein